jgi:AcrR family transcriptional regulator
VKGGAMAFEYNPIFGTLFESGPTKGDLVKARIIETVIQCISRKGIEETSYESIGKALKIRRSHVAYYFKDRDEMIELAVKYITSTAQALTVTRLQEETKPEKQVLAIVDGAFDWAEKHPDQVAVLLLFYHYCCFNKKYRAMMALIRNAGTERLTAVLGQMRASSGVGHRLTAKMVQAIIFGSLFEFFGTHDKSEVRKLQEIRRAVLEKVAKIIA